MSGADSDRAGMVRLTPELIHMGKSQAGGWSRAQLEALGLKWSDKTKGWIKRLSGTTVSREAYEKFLALAARSETTASEA